MGLREEQRLAAKAVQEIAARDSAMATRVFAGPGTGKSRAVAERTRWLIQDQQVSPKRIRVVSFTRAASADLRAKVHDSLASDQVLDPAAVDVGTLHSLALGVLRQAKLLEQYPVDPSVLDEWERKNLVDKEFALTRSDTTPGRAEDIREFHEAWCATEQQSPPNYDSPSGGPITQDEKEAFIAFHSRRSQTYSYVLPGEMVLKCVDQARQNLLKLRNLVRIDHLLVDEFQDLNPVDLGFVRILHKEGVSLWVCGDDDQSVYAFRHATPKGIQTFHRRYSRVSLRELTHCFRCTPEILSAAAQLLVRHAGPDRIRKSTRSLWETADPPVRGRVERWTFRSGKAEAKGVATACRDLIEAGENPSDILILINNKNVLAKGIEEALDDAGVAHDSLRAEPFRDTDVGRFLLSVLRIVCEPNNYVAHRTLLQTLRRVGVRVCAQIADEIVAMNVRFRDLFYLSAARDGFSEGSAKRKALERAAAICGEISQWAQDEELAERRDDLYRLAEQNRSPDEAEDWKEFIAALPGAITLRELKDYISADTGSRQDEVLESVRDRIGEDEFAGVPASPRRVRLMTLHGSKGLTAQYVFVPGLEEGVFPNQRQTKHTARVEEAARLLYVGMTRARIGLVLSWAEWRVDRGQLDERSPSRFLESTGGAFRSHEGGLHQETLSALLADARNL